VNGSEIAHPFDGDGMVSVKQEEEEEEEG